MEEGDTVTGIVGEGQSQGRILMMEVSETEVRGAEGWTRGDDLEG